jgi:hypothetical protein
VAASESGASAEGPGAAIRPALTTVVLADGVERDDPWEADRLRRLTDNLGHSAGHQSVCESAWVHQRVSPPARPR